MKPPWVVNKKSITEYFYRGGAKGKERECNLKRCTPSVISTDKAKFVSKGFGIANLHITLKWTKSYI